MSHLTEDEVVAFVDGEPDDRAEAHLAECDACRALVLAVADGPRDDDATRVDDRGGTEPMTAIDAAPRARAIARKLAETRVGACIGQRWTLEAVLGVGGMSYVYAARHRNGRMAAIKLLRPELCAVDAIVQRFLREGRVASRIDHPGAVAILDDGVDGDGTPFLVLELLSGETLRARVEREGPAPWPLVRGWLEEALAVVAAAHDRAIVHRDLKPDNLMLTEDGRVRVLDFGLARLREVLEDDEHTRTGVVMGTHGFMAPEQARGEASAIGPSSDVWSMAATAIALLTGRSPVDLGGSPLAHAIPASVPRDARAVLARALAPAPASRFADARAMLEALQCTSLDDRGAAPLRRWALAAGAVGSAALALTLVLSSRGAASVATPALEPLGAGEASPATTPAAASAHPTEAPPERAPIVGGDRAAAIATPPPPARPAASARPASASPRSLPDAAAARSPDDGGVHDTPARDPLLRRR